MIFQPFIGKSIIDKRVTKTCNRAVYEIHFNQISFNISTTSRLFANNLQSLHRYCWSQCRYLEKESESYFFLRTHYNKIIKINKKCKIGNISKATQQRNQQNIYFLETILFSVRIKNDYLLASDKQRSSTLTIKPPIFCTI